MLVLALREAPYKRELMGAQTIKELTESMEKAWNRIDEMSEHITAMEAELRRWRNYVSKLQRQIIEEFKGTPVPFETLPPKK